ncbi:MAG TPA: tetratricopeptide repeat protein [Leptolyngbyaceae cyanobacterium]
MPIALPPHNLPRDDTARFVGRLSALETLRRELQQGGRVTVSAFDNGPGWGRTELAMQYAHAFLQDYPGGVCWIQGQQGRIGEQVIEFAKRYLTLSPPLTLHGVPLTLEQQLDWCWQHWCPEGKVLVVIDDVSDLESCRTVLLAIAERFHMVVTTQDPDLLPRSYTLQLAGLSSDEALALLIKRRGLLNPGEESAASALCHWLAYSPLAIKLLGGYLCQRPTALSQARAQLEAIASRIEEIDGDLGSEADSKAYPKRLQALLELIWQGLSPDAQNVARLLSLFAPGMIPWEIVEWVLQALHSEDYSLHAARQQLEAFGLIDSVVSVVEGLQLHASVRNFFQTKLSAEAELLIPQIELERAFVATVAGIAQQIPQALTDAMVMALTPIVPHVAQVARHQTASLSDENLVWPFIGLGRFYQGQNLHSLAEPWWQGCVAVTTQRLGENHPDVAFSLNNLALLYHQQGRTQEAETLYSKALEQIRLLFGKADPTLSTGLNNLASLYRTQGRLVEAEGLYRHSLETAQQWGELPATLITSFNNLAELYRSQGRNDEAEPLYQEALAMAQQLFGKEHPTVAACLNNLAELYRAQERYREAETAHIRALKMRQRLFGKEHLAIATSLNNLAELYRIQGRYRQAERLYIQALEMTRRLMGEEHPAVATSMNNLAVLYACVRRFDKAIALLEQALAKRLKLLGESHPDTRRTLQSLENVKAAKE